MMTILETLNIAMLDLNGVRLTIDLDTNKVVQDNTTIAELTAEEQAQIVAVKALSSKYLGMVNPTKLQKIIFNKTKGFFTVQSENGKLATSFVSDISQENQVLVNQFTAICEAVKEDFVEVEWSAHNQLKIDDIYLDSSLVDEQVGLVLFRVGEVCKSILN